MSATAAAARQRCRDCTRNIFHVIFIDHPRLCNVIIAILPSLYIQLIQSALTWLGYGSELPHDAPIAIVFLLTMPSLITCYYDACKGTIPTKEQYEADRESQRNEADDRSQYGGRAMYDDDGDLNRDPDDDDDDDEDDDIDGYTMAMDRHAIESRSSRVEWSSRAAIGRRRHRDLHDTLNNEQLIQRMTQRFSRKARRGLIFPVWNERQACHWLCTPFREPGNP
jgi:hypothetical protein